MTDPLLTIPDVAQALRLSRARILAIDPGPVRSAWLLLEERAIVDHEVGPNAEVLRDFRAVALHSIDLVAIEKIEGFGMTVGQETFDTALWSGRFIEALHRVPTVRISRRIVKVHLCGDTRAKDANIRQALIDRIGPIGRKADPGPLYGITGDKWSALAVAVVTSDLIELGRLPNREE